MNYEAPRLAPSSAHDQLALPGAERPPRRLRIVIIAVVVLLVALLGWWIVARARPAAVPRGDQLPNVSVVVPGRQAVARVISATGSLASRRELPVGVAGEGGMITRVLVDAGQWVTAGQVLATIDRAVQLETAASLAAQIKVARSDEAIAQSELDRAQALVDRGFIAKSDLERKAATRDAALARVNVAQAQLGEQQARTGRLDIRAPAAGLVLTRNAEPGQIVGPASGTLFRMAKDGEMELQAQLSESDLAGLRVGMPADVTPVGSATQYPGQIWQVSPIIDPQTRQGIARVALRYNPALRPGGFATAAIRSGSSDSPELPNSAIQSDDRGNYVYVVGPDDKVVRRSIKVGDVSDQGVAVASGLNGNERVVLSAGAFLNAGQKIRPVAAKATN